MDDTSKSKLNGFVIDLEEVLLKELKNYNEVMKIEEEKKDILMSNTLYDLTDINEKLEKSVESALFEEKQRQSLCNKISTYIGISHDSNFQELIELLPQNSKEKLEKYNKALIITLEKIQQLNETNSAIILDNLKLINYNLSMITGNQETPIDYGDSVMRKYNPKPVIISTTV